MSNLYHHDMYDFNTPIKSYWEKIKTKDEFDSKQLNSDIKSDVVVIGGGGGSQAPRGVQSSGDSGTPTPQFSSTDPNNITIPVVKSLYNIMS